MSSIARLNFQTQLTRTPWAQLILLALAATATGWSLVSFQKLDGERAHLKDEIARAEARAQAIRRRATEPNVLKDDGPRALKLIAPLVYPWKQILAELEAVYGERVYVVRFEHTVGDAVIQLTVISADYEAQKTLEQRLAEASGEAQTWRIQSVSRTTKGLRLRLVGQALQRGDADSRLPGR